MRLVPTLTLCALLSACGHLSGPEPVPEVVTIPIPAQCEVPPEVSMPTLAIDRLSEEDAGDFEAIARAYGTSIEQQERTIKELMEYLDAYRD